MIVTESLPLESDSGVRLMPWNYTHGLHDVGNGNYAWLQPDGGWGWSNAGLVTDSGQSLLVDTLFDLPHAREMLDTMRRKVPAAARIGTVVNTHANGDHYFGNQLVADSEIIVSGACAAEMAASPPSATLALLKNTGQMGEVGEFLAKTMGNVFDFSGIVYVPPTRTFSGRLTLSVGTKEVQLIEVGPAHTTGDTLCYVPADKVVFTGDIVFNGGHPVVWAGPVDSWIRACDLILGLDVEVIVPGHGAISDKRSVAAMKHYFEWLRTEARRRYDDGMTLEEAINDITYTEFDSWSESERICGNIYSLYQSFDPHAAVKPPEYMFALMAKYDKEKKRLHGHV